MHSRALAYNAIRTLSVLRLRPTLAYFPSSRSFLIYLARFTLDPFTNVLPQTALDPAAVFLVVSKYGATLETFEDTITAWLDRL